MSDYTLHCMLESGNAYKPALMMELCGADWQAKWVNFFNGAHKSEEFLALNAMGEVPTLIDHTQNDLVLSQSGVMLYHLAGKHGQFGPQTDEEEREVLRWILFDNHKLTGNVSTFRVLHHFQKKTDGEAAQFTRARMNMALDTLNTHLKDRNWVAADRATIADISLCGYLFWPDHFDTDWNDYPAIAAWLARIEELPNYKKPEDILPSS